MFWRKTCNENREIETIRNYDGQRERERLKAIENYLFIRVSSEVCFSQDIFAHSETPRYVKRKEQWLF